MYLKTFTDKKLAQNAYLVGCQKTGEAIVIDPPRYVNHIIEDAKKEGLQIVAAADTHIHADYVSGARQLAVQYGTTLYLSDEGDSNWKYEYIDGMDVELVKEGSTFSIGNVDFEVMHTPGHTPESISFILTDRGSGATKPMGIFTGDFVFVGDVGRPDLLEEAAGMVGTAESGAKEMFSSVQRFKQLPDYLIVWPGHGAGSACGKSLGTVPLSTVGYEKQFNWALQIDDETTFIKELLKDQPEAPVYFAKMKQLNKIGPAIIKEKEIPVIKDATRLMDLMKKDDILVIDTRPAKEVQSNLVKGTINIPFNNAFTNWTGWLAKYDEKLNLIANEENRVEIQLALQSIGFDNVIAFVDNSILSHMETVSYQTISLENFFEKSTEKSSFILDVRNDSEWQQGHFERANHLFLGKLRELKVPTNKEIIVYCQSGARSAIAATILKARGVKHVCHLENSYQDAIKQGLVTQN